MSLDTTLMNNNQDLSISCSINIKALSPLEQPLKCYITRGADRGNRVDSSQEQTSFQAEREKRRSSIAKNHDQPTVYSTSIYVPMLPKLVPPVTSHYHHHYYHHYHDQKKLKSSEQHSPNNVRQESYLMKISSESTEGSSLDTKTQSIPKNGNSSSVLPVHSSFPWTKIIPISKDSTIQSNANKIDSSLLNPQSSTRKTKPMLKVFENPASRSKRIRKSSSCFGRNWFREKLSKEK